MFFEELATNLKRVDAFYLAQESTVRDAIADYHKLCGGGDAKATEAEQRRIWDLWESLSGRLQCFAEMNAEGFRKITKKFDKRVGSSHELPEFKDGLQQRMLKVLEGYHFRDAERRLATMGEGLRAAVDGLDDEELSYHPGAGLTFKKSPSELGIPLLHQKQGHDRGDSARKAQEALSYLWETVGLAPIVFSIIVPIMAKCDVNPKLTSQSYLVIWVTANVLMLLVRQTPPDMVLLSATLLLTVAGVLTSKEAWAAFSNSVVLSVAGLGVIASAVGETGVINLVFSALLGRPKSVYVAMLRLMLPAVVLNLGISNTCVMSCLLPVIDSWASETGLHRAFFLMPLSYLLLISGVFAIFSTSTNLVAQGMLIAHKEEPFDNFALAVPVTVASVVTLLYLVVLVPIILRRFRVVDKGTEEKEGSVVARARSQNSYDIRLQVVGRALEDKTLQDSGILGKMHGGLGDVLAYERYGTFLKDVSDDLVLKVDDIIWVHTSVEGLVSLFHFEGLQLLALDLSDEPGTLRPQVRVLVEAVLDKDSPVVTHRVGDASKYRPEYGCCIVAYREFDSRQREGVRQPPADSGKRAVGSKVNLATIMEREVSGTVSEASEESGVLSTSVPKLKRSVSGRRGGKAGLSRAGATSEVRLAHGDHVIFMAPPTFYHTWKDSSDFIVLRRLTSSDPEGDVQGRDSYAAPVSGCILLGLIALVASNTLELLEGVFLAIFALVLTGCTSMDSVVRAVKLRTVFTIVGAFGLGKAIGNARVAEVLSDLLIAALGGFGSRGLLVAIFAATVALGVIFHGTAVVVLMYPICAQVSKNMDIPIHQVIAVLCISVSCQMLSPISYQTNLMAYSTGDYTFADFTKVGAGLVFSIAAVSIPMCEWYFPA